jgi:hypothetical protein
MRSLQMILGYCTIRLAICHGKITGTRQMDFCRVKENWFKNSLHMKLENGLPSHDTFQRVWGMIEP